MDKDILFQDMTSREYTTREWLMFYRNVWTRNCAARTIDVECDKKLKAVDPKQEVPMAGGMQTQTVAERLEYRKIALQDALEVVAAADKLLALTDEELEAAWSPDALKVDADMMAAQAKEGDECDLDDGSGKGTLGFIAGQLVCVPKDAADTTVEAPASTETTDTAEKPADTTGDGKDATDTTTDASDEAEKPAADPAAAV